MCVQSENRKYQDVTYQIISLSRLAMLCVSRILANRSKCTFVFCIHLAVAKAFVI